MGNNDFVFPKNRQIKYNRFSKILATGSYLPKREVSNQEIIESNNFQLNEKVIAKTVGVNSRRKAEKGVVDSDILCKAAENCLSKLNIQPDNLSKLLVTKFIGDRILPMTASMVQRKLGSNSSFHAIDIDGGINSFLNALNLATRYISTTLEEEPYILILSGGINSAALSKKDPRIAFLFGDGAGAILLGKSKKNHFLASYEYTNWRHFSFAGSRDLKFSKEVSDDIFENENYSLLQDLYTMENWKETKDFYVKAIQKTKDALLEQANLGINDIDLFLITENNKQMFDLAAETLGINEQKTVNLIESYGNTMSAMLPLLLDYSFANDLIEEGKKIMLISYGEGISGGGVIYKV